MVQFLSKLFTGEADNSYNNKIERALTDSLSDDQCLNNVSWRLAIFTVPYLSCT